MSKVFLGVGHGGKDPGAVGYIKEADVNLQMALACKEYLEANGVQVQMSRTRDENDDLNEEIRECNAFNPDLAVDVHNNAGGGDGFEAYYHHLGGRSKILAQNIEAEVKAIGQNSRGCKTRLNSSGTADYYGFIRNTKASAVICEGVFVDNKADAAQADTLEEQRAFGIAYAKGILKTLGIEANNNQPVQNENVVTVQNVAPGDKLNIRTGPGTKFDVVGSVDNGTPFNLLSVENGCWGKTPQGYINLRYTDYKGNLSSNDEYYPACNSKCNSLVDALNSIGVDSSFSNRKAISQKNNVHNYSGTAQQNNQLLTKLKAGRLKK